MPNVNNYFDNKSHPIAFSNRNASRHCWCYEIGEYEFKIKSLISMTVAEVLKVQIAESDDSGKLLRQVKYLLLLQSKV
jgi:uncharacterized protein YaiE (UPF0345 family)